MQDHFNLQEILNIVFVTMLLWLFSKLETSFKNSKLIFKKSKCLQMLQISNIFNKLIHEHFLKDNERKIFVIQEICNYNNILDMVNGLKIIT